MKIWAWGEEVTGGYREDGANGRDGAMRGDWVMREMVRGF